jgi:hypothetical protein
MYNAAEEIPSMQCQQVDKMRGRAAFTFGDWTTHKDSSGGARALSAEVPDG